MPECPSVGFARRWGRKAPERRVTRKERTSDCAWTPLDVTARGGMAARARPKLGPPGRAVLNSRANFGGQDPVPDLGGRAKSRRKAAGVQPIRALKLRVKCG